MSSRTDTPDALTTGLITWRKALEAVPVRNRAVEVSRGDNGRVRIVVQKVKPRYFVAPVTWLVKPKLKATFELDRVGSDIWELCDGESDVESVAERFAAKHALSFHEARVAVSNYLKLLVERGTMALVQLEPSGEELAA